MGFRQYEPSDFSDNLPLFSPFLQKVYSSLTDVATEINLKLQRAIIDLNTITIDVYLCGIKD
jgi:hypothetical protein